jgi:hypothetical protein
MFTRQSADDQTQQEAVALAPEPFHISLVDADCPFYDPTPTTSHVEPSSLHAPPNEPTTAIATLQQFSVDASAVFAYLTEARPFNRTELNVNFDGEQQLFGLVDCAATLDFVTNDFARHFSVPTQSIRSRL